MVAMKQWSYLRQSDGRLLPLWVKASFNKNGYSIRLTDLSRVWAERLDKKDIIARARLCNCSIDPSEDVEQYEIFLEKLQSTLQQQGKTNLARSITTDGDLQLHLEAPLPSPLPAFEWEINLKQMSDRSVEVDLVSPLLQQAHNLNRHMQALIAEMQAKDKVIAKITDRLENAGYGLADVFPGAANFKLPGKKSQREQFARHVRGLGKFDEDAWAAEVAVSSNTSSTPRESADAVFASLPPVTSDAAEKQTSAGWWQQLPSGRHIPLSDPGPSDVEAAQSKKLHQEQSLNERSKSDVAGGDDDDDFQRQATPPHLRAQSRPPAIPDDINMSEADDNPPPDEDSTEDEDDLDGPPPRSKPSRHHIHNDSFHARATVETRTKTPSPPPVVNSTAYAPINHGPFTHEEDTEEDDDNDLDGPSQPSQKVTSASQLPSRHKSQTPQPSFSTASSPRRRPGTLGGRARTKSPTAISITPTDEPEEDPVPASPSPTKPKPKAKLGMIGGSKSKPQPTTAPITAAADGETPAPGKKIGTIGGKHETKSWRAATASATPEPQHAESAVVRKPDVKAKPAEPEDPVERANAKRDALRRQLAEKAKAPAKKKRKF